MAIEFRLFDALIETKYGVSVYDTVGSHDDKRRWCKETFGNNYNSSFGQYYFKTEADRAWFLLRWV